MASHHDMQPEDARPGARESQRGKNEARQTQLDFELEFFGRILAADADYADVLRVHGNNLTAKGLYARGLDADRRLARLRPDDPSVQYNLACSYSLLRMNDSALASLELALRLGYDDIEHMLRDADLEQVRRDTRFMGLLCRHLKCHMPRSYS
jgi:tetratricopeptide (TPR) repeat protein